MTCLRQDRQRRNGIALLIVLAFVVLLSAIAVALFSRATTDRQISFSSSNQTKAELFARGALALILGDLKQELVAGSTASTVSGVTIYAPNAAATTIPALVGSTGTGGLENLIKRSANGSAFFPTNANYNTATYPASNRAAASTTTAVSVNGRSITTARWNKPLLLQKATLTSDTDATPVAAFTPPDWINVARDGSNPTAWNVNMKASATNTTSVIGRYAYAIYDEGGLLDINVAGYPSPAPTPASYVQTIGRKGTSSFADLTQVPGVSALTTGATGSQTKFLNNIVGWRNYSSSAATGSLGRFASGTVYNIPQTTPFFSSILSNTNGFLLVSNTALSAPSTGSQSDRIFSSRQQLIALLVRGMASTASDRANLQTGLEYLGTFSREYNRPSWKPGQNATDMGAANNGTGNIYAYKNNGASSTAINRDLQTVRVTGTFTRADGSAAIVGEPLLKRRFLLARINELNNTANPNIQRDFGLTWDSTNKRWNYVGGIGSSVQSSIERLDQVAAENREPNLFELLKAVILSGSVGLGSGNANTFISSDPRYYITATTPSNLLSADYQIIQIGANIIDTWDSDNIPTFIGFKDPSSSTIYEVAGIENLPYLNKIAFCPFIPTSASQTVDAWLVPSLWNPHQNGSSAPSSGAGSRIHVALTGSPSYTAKFTVGSTTYTTNAIATSPTPTIEVSANGFMAPSPPQEMGSTAPLVPPTGAISSVGPPEKYYGFHFVFTTPPNGSQVNKDNTDAAYPDFGTTPGTGNLELQVLLADGSYKTYQRWNIAPSTPNPLAAKGIKNNGDWQFTNKLTDPEYVILDPRTLRFGVWGSDANGQGGAGQAKKDASYGAEDSMDQAKGKLEFINWSRPQGSQFTVTPSAPSDSSFADLSLYATNASGSIQYVDLDGVLRRGDWSTDANGTGSTKTVMYASSKTPPAGNYFDRPQNLSVSAPFQSVAELGHAFRDQPWKTLSLSTTNSADAGLLDVFTLQDVLMLAGRTSLNTRQSAVLAAILSQTTENIAAVAVAGKTSTSPTIASADITQIVSRLTALTTASPFINKAELVTKLMEDPALNTNLWVKSATNPYNKESRELVIRGLVDATQTRTWNLMIDVIAQSGKYPPNATSLANFVVEGEKRYWLHVAIDRFTGEVIDQQLEAVYE